MNSKAPSGGRLIAAVAGAALVLTACAASAPDASFPSDTASPAANGPLRGVAISPHGFPADFSQLAEFFTEVSAHPNTSVLWNGAWRNDVDGGTDAGGIPDGARLIAGQAAEYGFVPVAVFGWRSGDALFVSVPADGINDWTNAAAADAFVAMTAAFAAEYKPPFMFLGNESDAYFEKDPAGYAAWVAVYERAYDAIEAVSPETQVGPVLQFEHLSGNGPNTGWTEPQWGALEAHGGGRDATALARVDTLALTVYPFFAYDDPRDIPDDYLTPVLDRIGSTPIFITETGWPAESSDAIPSTWVASPGAQVDYVGRFDAFTVGVDIEGASWLFLYQAAPSGDLVGVEFALFASVALRGPNGSKRPAHDLWFAPGDG